MVCAGARFVGDGSVGAAGIRLPQCWQNANPAGVCLEQRAHVMRALSLEEAGAGAAGDAGSGVRERALGDEPEGSDTRVRVVVDEPDAAGRGTASLDEWVAAAPGSAVPHILQKFIPSWFCVRHLGQAVLSVAAAGAGAANFVPHSWQKSAPS
jgi:hypothetical protein